jgi:hypothetical protein
MFAIDKSIETQAKEVRANINLPEVRKHMGSSLADMLQKSKVGVYTNRAGVAGEWGLNQLFRRHFSEIHLGCSGMGASVVGAATADCFSI